MSTDGKSNLERNKEYWDSGESMALYGREPRLEPGEESLFATCFPAPRTALRVLDIGCGAGRTTYFFDRMGFNVTGMDISVALLDRARERFPHIDFRYGNAESLEFDDAEFDAVAFIANGLDCLSPVESRARCLAEICRVMKPGGIFLCSHHNLPALAFGWYRMMRPWKLRMRLKNILNGNFFKPGCYISYDRDSGGLPLYYAWPAVFISEIKAAGFDYMGIRPNSRVLSFVQDATGSTAMTRMSDPWPNYAFRKREAPPG